jgi:hypothetical protein
MLLENEWFESWADVSLEFLIGNSLILGKYRC